MVHVVIDRYVSLFLKGLKSFLNPRLSLIVPLSSKFLHSKAWNYPYREFVYVLNSVVLLRCYLKYLLSEFV